MQNSKPAKRPFWSVISALFWLVFLFTGLALFQLALVNNTLSLTTFVPLVVLLICAGATIYCFNYRRVSSDPLLLPLVFFLCGLGLALIVRLAPAFVIRQLFWLLIGTSLLLAVVLVPQDLNWLRRYKYTWLLSGLLLLASTLLFGVNPSGFGARLWLQVGGFFFQPSEVLKLLLIVFLAAYLTDRRRQLIEARTYIAWFPIPHPSYWGPLLLMWGFSIILLIWQRDLGAALLFFGTFLGMIYAATGQSRYVWAGALLLVAAAIMGYILFDVVRLRVDAFLNPWLDASGRSFQIVQSLLAFASGGVWGQGLGQGLPSAIPVVHTDFVYAAIGEEYGLLGALGVLLCFALLIARAFHIGIQAKNGFEQLLAVGIGTMLGLQTIIITAGTLKLMPLTGITLPFVSYGGSSLVTNFLMVGVLVFIANHNLHPQQSTSFSLINEVSKTPTELREAYVCRMQHHTLVQGFSPHPTWPYRHLAHGLFTALLIVAGGLILWQIVAAPFLLPRDDNPRLVVAEQKIKRGRLLTRNGIAIAQTISGPDGLVQRNYPYPSLSSVTGYYSIRYGLGGAEATFDSILRGTADYSPGTEFMDALLHRPLVGQDITLSIDLPAQIAADVALGNQEGAVVVLDLETNGVLVMSSHPTYDPNTLDEQWDILRQDEQAPLLNRSTQGLFPVGDLARLIGLIGLYESGTLIPTTPLTTPLESMLNPYEQTEPHLGVSLALQTPLESLLSPLGQTGYEATAHQLGFMRPLPKLRSQGGRLPDFADKGTVRDLAATPLHLARMMAALELEGRLPQPVLALSNDKSYIQAIRPDTARMVRALLPLLDDHTFGLSGIATPQETGQRSLSWFVGLGSTQVINPSAQVNKARYAVVVVLVTDTPADEAAFRIAKAALKALFP